MDYQQELNVAITAARLGGSVLREGIGTIADVRSVGYKGQVDLVTEFDHRSEQLILSFITDRFPDHSILAEEGSGARRTSEFRWIVDPLDGTTNFVHGYPVCCVSIALEHEGKIVVGAVYDPFREELFSAVTNRGALLNDQAIHVSQTPDLAHSLLATGFPYDRSQLDEVLLRFGLLTRLSQAVRRDGAAALNLCYVACGRFDGFWEAALQPWDVAAGALIITEAGGIITDFAGTPWCANHHSAIAANSPALFEEIHRALR
ncbi:MAG: inositol monophosphatase [Chloroflexi bacterium]|nr:inositol monophosphatase [Chloroflexota bacterium]